MPAKYDIIGNNYAELRKPDHRIAGIIERALGSAQTVLNVGAGTGSYEPVDRSLIAVEPSREMIRKRKPAAAEAIEASADDLPFDDNSFDASMAILTIHHWPDKEAGLREMRRVTRGRIVLLTFDPSHRPWLTEYLPELAALDEAQMPAMSDYERWLGSVQVTPVPVRDADPGMPMLAKAVANQKVRIGSTNQFGTPGRRQKAPGALVSTCI